MLFLFEAKKTFKDQLFWCFIYTVLNKWALPPRGLPLWEHIAELGCNHDWDRTQDQFVPPCLRKERIYATYSMYCTVYSVHFVIDPQVLSNIFSAVLTVIACCRGLKQLRAGHSSRQNSSQQGQQKASWCLVDIYVVATSFWHPDGLKIYWFL